MRLALLVVMPLALAQQPRLVSGRLESHAAAGATGLSAQLRGFSGPAWVGYSIDAVPGHRGCCTNISDGICSMGCALEGGGTAGAACPTDSTLYLEGERSATVLFRVDKGEIERVRTFSPACPLDIGGLTLHWLGGVRSADSVAFLKTLTNVKNVVNAIAVHADPAAEEFLRQTAESPIAPRSDRDRAAHALTSTRGANGLAVVTRLLANDPDERFRESLTSAIAQAPNNAGTSPLIQIASTDKSRKVRERAFFWLGHSRDPRAQRFVEQVLAK